MQITDIMTIGVEVIQPEAPVRIAAEKMRNFNVGFLPVCDREKLVGMLTDRDITVRTVAPGIDLNTPVRELMTPKVIFCYYDQTLDEARQLMQEHLIRRLPKGSAVRSGSKNPPRKQQEVFTCGFISFY